jgi:HAD superfamily hydrolase (TIGR01459 family)
MSIKQYKNIRSIVDNYDAFLIDLWGVIHDGVTAYPGVNECLSNMKDAGKKIIFLSNAPRRAFRAAEGLARVGVPDDLYDHIITSGEVTYEYLKASDHGLGKNYYIIGPERDAGLLDGLDYVRVKTPAQAGFVIVTGFEEDSSTLEEKIPELQECLKYNLLLICANPDYVVVRQTGARALCAGAMAEKYQEIGGKTMQFGKPYPEVYKKCLSLTNNISLEKIAAIGDNLDTDIKGANNSKLDSYLIAGGVLGEELGIKHGELPLIDKLQEVCEKSGSIPTAVLPAFVW